MNFRLTKIEQLSGKKATIYAVELENEIVPFDEFITNNLKESKDEIEDILKRLRTIGDKTGAREHFFKTKEGKPGDGVCALFDRPDKNLRLYCIRMGSAVLILGGGGSKPKSIRKLQEDPKLKKENYLLRNVSIEITKKMKSEEIRFSEDELEFLGNLEFYD